MLNIKIYDWIWIFPFCIMYILSYVFVPLMYGSILDARPFEYNFFYPIALLACSVSIYSILKNKILNLNLFSINQRGAYAMSRLIGSSFSLTLAFLITIFGVVVILSINNYSPWDYLSSLEYIRITLFYKYKFIKLLPFLFLLICLARIPLDALSPKYCLRTLLMITLVVVLYYYRQLLGVYIVALSVYTAIFLPKKRYLIFIYLFFGLSFFIVWNFYRGSNQGAGFGNVLIDIIFTYGDNAKNISIYTDNCYQRFSFFPGEAILANIYTTLNFFGLPAIATSQVEFNACIRGVTASSVINQDVSGGVTYGIIPELHSMFGSDLFLGPVIGITASLLIFTYVGRLFLRSKFFSSYALFVVFLSFTLPFDFSNSLARLIILMLFGIFSSWSVNSIVSRASHFDIAK